MDKTIHEKIEALSRRIQELAQQQTGISNQLVQLIDELQSLKRQVNASDTVVPEQTEQIETVETIEVREVIEAPHRSAPLPPTPPRPAQRKVAAVSTSPSSTTFEEFIGKN